MRLATPLEPWMGFTLPLRSYITLLILASFVSADGTVTLFSLPAYTSQRACAQLCFSGCIYCGIGPWTAGLMNAVGCDLPFLDSCMCRTDLFSSAEGYLSTCVSSACSSDSVDINSALSIYGSYCAEVNSPATNAATTTPAGGSSSITTTITATIFSTNGALTTSPISPIVTVISGSVTYNGGECNGDSGGADCSKSGSSKGASGLGLSFLYVSISLSSSKSKMKDSMCMFLWKLSLIVTMYVFEARFSADVP
jgi:hypothetical protein